MSNIEQNEEKLRMLEEMENNCWETEVNEKSSYKEVEEAYNEMIEEYEASEADLYPNGRDYDAENFDD
jgi:hypothetical protein